MRKTLRLQLSLMSAFCVLVTICIVSLSANILISRRFDRYIENEQALHAQSLAEAIAAQYDGDWNLDYIHGFGMYALSDGYILKVYDDDGSTVWDAENHDMALCHAVMASAQLQASRPRHIGAREVSELHPLEAGGLRIGEVRITYYAPNYAHEEDYFFLRSLNRILLLTGVAALIASVLVGILMAGRIAGPMTEATALTRAISAGKYSLRIRQRPGCAELVEMTDAVNQMAQDLEQEEKRRRRLTQDVAHELRTPIANLTSYLEAMEEGALPATPASLGECRGEAARLGELVGQLEMLHRTEEERELHLQGTSLYEMCREVRDAFAASMQGRGQSCQILGEDARCRADRAALRQILDNLMSNAVKYSPDGSMITLRIIQENRRAGVAMEDQGMGIPEEELVHVFERFYRTDLSRSRKTGGAGIGLTIARAQALAMGGEISVASEMDKGSTFTVWLPMEEQRG